MVATSPRRCVRGPICPNVGRMMTSRLPRFVALVAALVVLASPLLASAAPAGPDALPVHVVSVKSDDALDQAEALSQSLRKAVRDSEGWSLGDTTQSLEFLALKMQCAEPIDASCEARIADVIKADRFLWCVVQFESDDKQFVVGTLNFFERGKGTNTVALRYSANLTDAYDDSLIKVASEAVDQATGGPPQGGLKVVTGGVAGQIFVDGEPVGALGAEGSTIQLPAGEHRVVVKAPGYADAEGTAHVRPATTVELSLTMVEQADEDPIDLRMVGGFVSLGVGVASGAVGLWAALKVNSIQAEPDYIGYRDETTAGQNLCDTAAAGKTDLDRRVDTLCGEASTMEIIQAIMFPVAGVAAGVGIFLLGTSSLVGGSDDADDADEPSAWTVQPMVGPDRQAIAVTYRF